MTSVRRRHDAIEHVGIRHSVTVNDRHGVRECDEPLLAESDRHGVKVCHEPLLAWQPHSHVAHDPAPPGRTHRVKTD